MDLRTMDDLLAFGVLTMRGSERVAEGALDEIASETLDADARALILRHRDVARDHASRLENAARALGAPSKDLPTISVDGILAAKRAFLQLDPTRDVLEAYDLGMALRLEHFLLGAYELLAPMAARTGHGDVAALLRENQHEKEDGVRALASLVDTPVTRRGSALPASR